MIWESHPWREELGRIAERLESWKAGVDWDDEYVSFEIERDVMWGAYAIRKLLDAYKLPDSLARSKFGVERFPLIDRVPDYMNWDQVDEFYDFSRRDATEVTLTQLCNQLVHSFVWIKESSDTEGNYDCDAAGLAGFFVASDRERYSRIYRIGVDTLIGLFRSVRSEEVVSSRLTRNTLGQWKVSNLSAADI